MKLELVKETKINGTILYSVEMDGKYVSNTATENLKQAAFKQDKIKKDVINFERV